MVPIRQREIQIKNDDNLCAMFFYALNDINMGKFDESKFCGDDLIAYKGYCREKVLQSDIEKIIARPKTRGMDYSNNIYRFVGVHLANPYIDVNEIKSKFLEFNFKNKYAVALFFIEFEQLLKEQIKASNNDFAKLLNMLYNKEIENLTQEDNELFTDLENNSQADIIEVILYKSLVQKFRSIKVNGLSAIEATKHILSNFQYSVKGITERRKGKTKFEINDEYDVQDIVYLMLKGIFHDLQVENPFMKRAGKSSKIDLISTKEKIAIETKMMLDKYTSKEIIKQLKIDIIDYSTWREMRDLVIFVYDPRNKISDNSEFSELSGVTENGGTRYKVHVVISN